jgi:hypothetical protein
MGNNLNIVRTTNSILWITVEGLNEDLVWYCGESGNPKIDLDYSKGLNRNII